MTDLLADEVEKTRFSIYSAEFAPRRTDDLREGVHACIGQRFYFVYDGPFDPDEFAPGFAYLGDARWQPLGDTEAEIIGLDQIGSGGIPATWVPGCDLRNLRLERP